MYYSFYMNERMLLDNWKYYQRKGECNWLLKRTLMNDNTRSAAMKKAFYYANRRVVNYYSDFFKEQAEKVWWQCFDLQGRFDNKAQEEYYLDHLYINDGYEFMDYGHNQRVFNMYRRYNDLKEHANDKVNIHLSFEPIKNAKFREYTDITIHKTDLKFIRNARKRCDLTVPQIEILFGIIFFCRMYDSERANLNSFFRKQQFIGCFDTATFDDLYYVGRNVPGIEIVEEEKSKEFIYHGFDTWYENHKDDYFDGSAGWIDIPVTKQNNKLNLSKMARKYIPDLKDKRYCKMCLKPFKPTNNRQKVCEHCKPKADAIKAKLRKNKQRFIEKNGKDACCGKCTDCIRMDCKNWWEYWSNELPYLGNMTDEQKDKALDQLLYKIKNVYTDEEKSEILPWDMIYEYKRI